MANSRALASNVQNTSRQNINDDISLLTNSISSPGLLYPSGLVDLRLFATDPEPPVYMYEDVLGNCEVHPSMITLSALFLIYSRYLSFVM